MKKLFYLAMSFAAAAMTFVSCSKDDTTDVNAPVLSGETKTITLKTELAETRTTLDAEHAISWAAGDQYGILLANSDGQIIEMTESSPYTGEGAFESELTVPKEAVYVCAYYPRSVVKESSEDLHGKSIWSIPVSVEEASDGKFAGVNYMAAKGEITEDSTSLVFKPFVTVLEVLVYDSKGAGDDQLSMVTVSSEENICGAAILDLSDDAAALSGWTGNSINGYGNGLSIGTSADDAAVAYVAVAKGEYSFKVTVTTFEHFDTPYTKTYTHNLEKDGYTIKIDLATADHGIEAPETEDGVVEEFTVLDNLDYRYDSDYPGVLQYGFTMRDTNYVTFSSFPQMTSFSVLHYTDGFFFDDEFEPYDKVTFEDGVLTFTDEELVRGEFKIFVYGGGETTRAEQDNVIAILCVTYATSMNEGGNEGDDELISGAMSGSGMELSVIKMESGVDGFLDSFGCPQYKLELQNVWTVFFQKIPDEEYLVFTSFSAGQPAEGLFVNLGSGVGYDINGKTSGSGSYYVVFGDVMSPTCILYVVYSDGEDGGDDDDNPVFVLDKSSETTATLRLTTESDTWWSNGFPEAEQWTLIVNGSDDGVMFTNFPNVDPKPVVLGQHDYEYFELNPQGNKMSVFLLGDAYGFEDSAEYDVAFYDAEDVYVVLHVRYNIKDDEGGEDELIENAWSAGSGSVTLTRMQQGDSGYFSDGSFIPQYKLVVDGATIVGFDKYPEEEYEIYKTFPGEEYDGGKLFVRNYGMFTIADDNSTNGSYYVLFGGIENPIALLYVVYNYGSSSVPTGNLFELSPNNISDATLRMTTPEDDWYMSSLDYEQWTLIVKGSDVVTFSKVPDLTGFMIMGDIDNEHEYFAVEQQGTVWMVTLSGTDWGKGSASYDITFYDSANWGEQYCRLHVEWSK